MQAEAEWWKRCEGYQQGWSDWLLGFDCGGQQWVLEACFPSGTVKEPNGADLQYMEDLLRELEAARIPAPSPIEQRWTCGSASHMSPAGVAPGEEGDCQDQLFSWVGIIMYLPSDNDRQRAAITKRFKDYVNLSKRVLFPKYGAVEHWAKIEPAELNKRELTLLQKRLGNRYPMAAFHSFCNQLDPKGILTNEFTDLVLAPQQT